MYLKGISPALSFSDAAELYMKSRSVDAMPGAVSARYVRLNTERSYKQYIDSLNLYFGTTKLENIHWYTLKAYQEARAHGAPPFIRRRRPHEEPGPCPTKTPKINQELRFLVRILKRANSWNAEDEEYYEPLQEDEPEVKRALEPAEQQKWLEVSRMQERWMVVHWYSLLAFDTAMSTNEQRALRLADVNLRQQVISVPWPGSKNKYRHRTIALDNADAAWACERLLARAHDLGSREATDYIFPIFDKRAQAHIPNRQMSVHGIRKLWLEIRDATGLKGFRPYDTRHTSITRMAEAGMPIEVIKAKAGHITDQMNRHYTQISLAAQRRWARIAAQSQFRPGSYAPPDYEQYPERRPPAPCEDGRCGNYKGKIC